MKKKKIDSILIYRSLENSTRKMDELSHELKQVDNKVEKYRTTFEKFVGFLNEGKL